jgi:hypothetical protein
MFEEVDKGFDPVTAYYVQLRLMRCGLAAVLGGCVNGYFFHLWCNSMIYHLCEMRRKLDNKRGNPA